MASSGDSMGLEKFIQLSNCLLRWIRQLCSSQPRPIHYKVQSFLGRPLSSWKVSNRVGPLTMQVSAFHQEEIHPLVLEQVTTMVILGNLGNQPELQCKSGEILRWGFPFCFPWLLKINLSEPRQVEMYSTSFESPPEKLSVSITECYCFFCPPWATYLPSHKSWDSTIDLKVGEPENLHTLRT